MSTGQTKPPWTCSRLIARRFATARLLIVLSYREEAVDAGHPLRVMLGELSPGLPVVRVRLEPLTPDGVAELAQPYGVDPDGLHRVTGGNPFFVTEVLASGEHEIPATIRDAVLARAARLAPAARRLLEAVSIVTPQAELWLVEALSGEIDAKARRVRRLGHARFRERDRRRSGTSWPA